MLSCLFPILLVLVLAGFGMEESEHLFGEGTDRSRSSGMRRAAVSGTYPEGRDPP